MNSDPQDVPTPADTDVPATQDAASEAGATGTDKPKRRTTRKPKVTAVEAVPSEAGAMQAAEATPATAEAEALVTTK